MTDAVKMAIARIKARFHPHYGIDGASDSKQLASDCQTLIAALEQAGEPVGLMRHFNRMMEAAANYLEPTTYHARHPNTAQIGDCAWVREFPMPEASHSLIAAKSINDRRDKAFINDMIYMLDGPEQREAMSGVRNELDPQAAFNSWEQKRGVWPRVFSDEAFKAGWHSALSAGIGAAMTDRVPHDVASLVVAGREAWEYLQEHCPNDNVTASLGKALEEFASRVCWDDEGGSIPEAHADPCTCAMAEIQRLGQEFDAGEELGRFGHHPDARIDYECETDALIGMAYDRLTGMAQHGDLEYRICRAIEFRTANTPGELRWLSQKFNGTREVYAVEPECLAALATPSKPDPQSREPSMTVDDAWQDLVDKDDRTSPEEYPDMALITREELADYMQAAQSRGQAFDGEGEARADDIRRSIIRQLGGDPHADRIILPGTDWDIVLAALSSAKRGEEG
ncbi:hypothetical protein [Sphingobium yanoikuyae]|uniref:hypothetical protein n=1 Tax=Sphingobium yanoikuyae TaxID=13690 RepID=UPI00345EF7C1